VTWAFEVSPEFERDYRKTCHRNAGFRKTVDTKVAQILEDPMRFKPLRAPMQGLRRVHVGGSYVIVFEPDSTRKSVRFLRLAHHDEAYGL
jgi:YafQ family addiction module toxin component